MINMALDSYAAQQWEVAKRLEVSRQDQMTETTRAFERMMEQKKILFQKLMEGIKGDTSLNNEHLFEEYRAASDRISQMQLSLIQPRVTLSQRLDAQLVDSTNQTFHSFCDTWKAQNESVHRIEMEKIRLHHQSEMDLIAVENARLQAEHAHTHARIEEEQRHQRVQLNNPS